MARAPLFFEHSESLRSVMEVAVKTKTIMVTITLEVFDMWVLRGAGLIVGTYAIFKLGGIGIHWLKEFFNNLQPERYRK